MPKDPALKKFTEIAAMGAGIEPEVMYEIRPTIIATKDGSSALVILAGWFDGYLCAFALPFLGDSTGNEATVYYKPDPQARWVEYTTSPAGSTLKAWLYHHSLVIAALHRTYMSVPRERYLDMKRRAQQNETTW